MRVLLPLLLLAGLVGEEWEARHLAGEHAAILAAPDGPAAPSAELRLASRLAGGGYDAVLEVIPADAAPPLLALRLEALRRRGGASQAMQELGELPDGADLRLVAAQVALLRELGRWSEAEAVAERVLLSRWREVRREDADPAQALAAASVVWQAAVQPAYTVAERLAKRPDRIGLGAQLLVARIAGWCNETRDVRETLKQVLLRDPGQVEALILRAQQQADPVAALADLRLASRREPQRLEPLVQAIGMAVKLGDPAHVAAEIAQAQALAPGDPQLLGILAMAQELVTGEPAELAMPAERLAHPQARLNLGSWCWCQDRPQAAAAAVAGIAHWQADSLAALAALAAGDDAAGKKLLEAAFAGNEFQAALHGLLNCLDREADTRHWTVRRAGPVAVRLRSEVAEWLWPVWEPVLESSLTDRPSAGPPSLHLVLCPDPAFHRARCFGAGDGSSPELCGALVIAREPDPTQPTTQDVQAVITALRAAGGAGPRWLRQAVAELAQAPDREPTGLIPLAAWIAENGAPGLPGIRPGRVPTGAAATAWQQLVLAEVGPAGIVLDASGRVRLADAATAVAARLAALPVPVPATEPVPPLPVGDVELAALAASGPEQHLRAAWSLVQAGRRDDARRLVAAIEAAAPGRALTAWLMAEDVWAVHGDAERASAHLLDALGRQPDHYPSLVLGAFIASAGKEPDIASAFLERALSVSELPVAGHDPLLLMLPEDLTQRRERLERVCRRRPDSPAAVRLLVAAHREAEDPARALASVERGLGHRLFDRGLLELAVELAAAAGDEAAAGRWRAVLAKCPLPKGAPGMQ